MQPSSGKTVTQPQPRAKNDRRQPAGRHNTVVKLALHYLEPVYPRLIRTHGMIDKQPGQIKQPGKPGHHGNDM